MQFSYCNGLAHAVQAIPLVLSTAVNLQGLSQDGEILLFACFSLALYNTLPILPYQLPRHLTLSNGESLFPPKHSSGYNFLRTSGMVHPPQTSLFVSLLLQCQFFRRQLSTL